MEIDNDEIKENKELFYREEDLLQWEKDEGTSKIESLELNDIKDKDNDYLLIGIFGNGSGYLKASFFNEMKTQRQSFKVKVMVQSKDKSKKKQLCAEIYQLVVEGSKILIVLTKENMNSDAGEFIFKYFEDNKINFKQTIIFESNFSKDLIIKGVKDFNDNICYYIKSRNCTLNTGEITMLPPPNGVYGFCAFALNWLDYRDLPCLVLITSNNYYDIGIDSVKIFDKGVKDLRMFKGKLDEEYLKKMKIELNQLNAVFIEFNSIKKSYFS